LVGGVLLVDGFPFANAFKPSMAKAMPLIYLAAAIPILFYAGIKRLHGQAISA
jgi:hypothetical protein